MRMRFLWRIRETSKVAFNCEFRDQSSTMNDHFQSTFTFTMPGYDFSLNPIL